MVNTHWNESLTLGFAPIDDLHKSLIEQIAAVDDCPDALLANEWTTLVACAKHLFDRENNWMVTSRFASAQHHALHHRVVLNVLLEGLALARDGQVTEVRAMLQELRQWLAKHTQSQDAALALHLRRHPEVCPQRMH